MATYAGVTLSILHPEGFSPHWSQESVVSERIIPYANYAEIQVAGRGNFRLAALALISADADIPTLQAAVGTTLRTLTNPFGDSVNYSNVALVGVGVPGRAANKAKWQVPLTFVRKGS